MYIKIQEHISFSLKFDCSQHISLFSSSYVTSPHSRDRTRNDGYRDDQVSYRPDEVTLATECADGLYHMIAPYRWSREADAA